MIEVVNSCPLGSRCEEIKDNKMHRCKWYIHVAGLDPSSGEKIDKYDCSMSLLPLLLIENARCNLMTTGSIDNFREEMRQTNESSLNFFNMITNAAQSKLIGKS